MGREGRGGDSIYLVGVQVEFFLERSDFGRRGGGEKTEGGGKGATDYYGNLGGVHFRDEQAGENNHPARADYEVGLFGKDESC